MSKINLDIIDKYFMKVEHGLPPHKDVVICLDLSSKDDIRDDFFYGLPATIGYYDEEKEQWFDQKYVGEKGHHLDFRDFNHNTAGSYKNTPTHWMDEVELSLFLLHIIEGKFNK
jgi:hypothetical protein